MRRSATPAVALALLLSACSGSPSPTSGLPSPPTSELIGLQPTTTTTQPPGPLDPIDFEELGVAVSIPRDWDFRTGDVRFGTAAALYRANNDTGALIIVGSVSDTAPNLALDAAPSVQTLSVGSVLAQLFDVADDPDLGTIGTIEESANIEADGQVGQRTVFSLTQTNGIPAVITVHVIDVGQDTAIYVAFLYERELPADRIAQGESSLDSVTMLR